MLFYHSVDSLLCCRSTYCLTSFVALSDFMESVIFANGSIPIGPAFLFWCVALFYHSVYSMLCCRSKYCLTIFVALSGLVEAVILANGSIPIGPVFLFLFFTSGSVGLCPFCFLSVLH